MNIEIKHLWLHKCPKKWNQYTLIALVITIIVLLILAGITIATLIGDNGLLTKTSEAQFRTEIAQYKEELNLSVINDEAEHKGKRTNKFNETEYSKIKQLIPSFNKKYENSLVVEEDKLVYKGNDKELYRKALEIGLIPEDELLDDEILEELQPFITEWTVEANDTITLPISGTCNFTVNYGDSAENFQVTSSTDEDRIHTYTNSGAYTVTIKGKCSKFDFGSINTSKEKITKIVQWGALGNELSSISLCFKDCTNLKGTIPSPSKNSFKNVSSFGSLFQGCSSLEGPIPSNLFYNCSKVTSFGKLYHYGCFYGCEKLKGNIPEKLFKDCQNVATFGSCFRGCKSIDGTIPEKLFEKNTKATDFEQIFENCISLTGSIPEKLFENCIEIKDIRGAFQNCINLTGNIPESLLKNCTGVTTFGNLYNSGLFYGCKGLSGQIPENLFENCTNVQKFNCVFYGCTGLTGSIPEKLFENCTEATDMSYVFCGCTGLTGSIPKDLFKDCTKIQNLNSTFSGCNRLTGSIPKELFENCPNITSLGRNGFEGCFMGCTGLTGEIPSELFLNCNNITSFNCAFRNCSNLTGAAPEFWNRTNVTTSILCFSGCTKLSNYNQIPSSWGGGGE